MCELTWNSNSVETYDRILIFSIYISSDNAHSPEDGQRPRRASVDAIHSLASRDPDFQTCGVVQELGKKLKKLGYMRLERIHHLFQDGVQDKDTDLTLGGIGGGHGGVKEGQ
jgi:hypothetical protein